MSNTVTGLPRQPLGSPSQRFPGADGQKRKTRQRQRGGWRRIRQAWRQWVLVQPRAGLLLRSLQTGCVLEGERRGGGFPRLLGHSCGLPRYCLCPLSTSKGQERHSLGAQTSQPGTPIRNTHSMPFPHLSYTHTHTHSLTQTHTHTVTRETTPKLGPAPHAYTVFGGTLISASPLHVAASCQPYHPPPKKTNNSFHKLFLKEQNKTEHKQERREEEEEKKQRPKSLHEKQALRRKILAAK